MLRLKGTRKNEQKIYFLEKKIDKILDKLEQILFILHKS